MIQWTVARQAPLSMEFSRQEYWSGLPFPPPGDLLDPGIESSPCLMSPALADRFFTTSAMLSEINQTQKDKFHLQMLPKIVKFTERESQIVTARA